MLQLFAVEQDGQAIVMDITHRYEILLILMLHHHRHQIIYLTCLTEEDLALAIWYVFLDI